MRHIKVTLLVLVGFAFVSVFCMNIASAATCAKGIKTQVEWKSKWYPAKILKIRGNKEAYINYTGWESSWDEWVGPKRIKCTFAVANPFPKGSSVMVKWKGSWYKAKVLTAKKKSWKITYDGSQWDETVGPDRIKKK